MNWVNYYHYPIYISIENQMWKSELCRFQSHLYIIKINLWCRIVNSKNKKFIILQTFCKTFQYRLCCKYDIHISTIYSILSRFILSTPVLGAIVVHKSALQIKLRPSVCFMHVQLSWLNVVTEIVKNPKLKRVLLLKFAYKKWMNLFYKSNRTFYVIMDCTGYLSTYALPIKSISSRINPTLDFLPLIFTHFTLLISVPSPTSTPYSFQILWPKIILLCCPLHYGTTYHSKSVLPIMWKFLNPCLKLICLMLFILDCIWFNYIFSTCMYVLSCIM